MSSSTHNDSNDTDPRSSRHERVLDEAARQFNAKGVLLTSLAEIAASLGVSRNAMYYYVADREDLVFQCYRRAAEITARHLHEAARVGGTADRILRAFIERMLDPTEPEIAARAELALLNPTQRDTIQGLYDAIATRIAHLMEAGQREGVLRQCDVEANARIVLSLVTWAPLARPWAQAVGPLGHSRLLAAVVATVFEGFSTASELPNFEPMSLQELLPKAPGAFDRAGTIAAKRDTLMREASRLFNRKGIDSTSLDEIAAQVGTTKRNLHHHIGGKADLVLACYERAFRMFFFVRDRMVDYEGTRLTALAAAMHTLALMYTHDELCPLLPLVGYGALAPEGQEKINRYGQELGEQYHRVIRSGIEEGSICELDVEARALMLPGLISWLVKEDALSEATGQQHIATEIANLVAIGLGSRK